MFWGSFSSKTMMGIWLSIARVMAVVSVAWRCRARTSSVGQVVITPWAGGLGRVRRVDPVHIFGKQNGVRPDLHTPEHRARIGGEIGVTGAQPKMTTRPPLRWAMALPRM